MIIRLTSPACEVVPASIKLFVDEHLDAPPAIFTVKAIKPGPAALIFSVWQEGGQIASVSHLVQVVDAAKQPRAGIRAGSSTIPMQAPAPPWGVPWSPRPGAEAVGPIPAVTATTLPSETAVVVEAAELAPRHVLRRWLGLVALLWVVAGIAVPLPVLTVIRLGSSMGALPLTELPAIAAQQNTLCALGWPTLVFALVAVQIVAASLYWRNRGSDRVGRWLPATLLVGFLSLLVGISIAVAILLLLQ